MCRVVLSVALAVGVAMGATVAAANAAAKIRLAQSSTVTNCMMACNARSATCQTTCLVPGTPPTNAATATGNANLNTNCQLNCSTQQIACQTICAQQSPTQ